jgi:hypothetical protein
MIDGGQRHDQAFLDGPQLAKGQPTFVELAALQAPLRQLADQALDASS